jgi:phospholipase C
MNRRSSSPRTVWAIVRQGIALVVASQLSLGSLVAYAAPGANDAKTKTPIKHVIIIIGENRTFDHLFATYVPKRHDQTVSNLLSKGIIKADGTPGPRYALSTQYTAQTTSSYEIDPATGKAAYTNIPAPEAGGNQFASDTHPPPFVTASVADADEPNLEPEYAAFLLTGATGLPPGTVDTRIANVNDLGPGVFQLTPGLPYDAYAASPVHRFYQMWQELDCDASKATRRNPSGCQHDLFPWVETTIGAGSNGNPLPTNLNTGEGGTSMAFYNMQQGDVPFFKHLADEYTISDNYHQAGLGGTGLNHILFGFADGIWYSDGAGNALTPPSNEIENPNPQPGTNNWYTQDGYSGGSYSNCADASQPGVSAVEAYLAALHRPINPHCEAGHYYLLNNYNPGFTGTGQVIPPSIAPFTIPPTSVRHIGDVLSEHQISYTYFGEGWDAYQTDPTESNLDDEYCNICNPFQYATDIMTNPAERAAHIQDVPALISDIANNALPAVSIVKPSGYTDGHPASSKFDLFEGFVKNILDKLDANEALRHETAVFITVDEGGGYYDSGYVQALDFFGDGTRIPLIIVSDYTRSGRVSHSYGDHVSLIKFIERNWNLPAITGRSRDNFPNPVQADENPYVPVNSPALTDLFDAFHFPDRHDWDDKHDRN